MSSARQETTHDSLNIYVGSPDGLSELPIVASRAPGDFVALPYAALERQIARRGINPASAMLYFQLDGVTDARTDAGLSEGPAYLHLARAGDPVAKPGASITSFANERVVVDGLGRRLFIDGTSVQVSYLTFRLFEYLSEGVDIAHSNSSIKKAMDSLSNNVPNLAYAARKALGKELGDAKQGAIRTVRTFGYMAVSQL